MIEKISTSRYYYETETENSLHTFDFGIVALLARNMDLKGLPDSFYIHFIDDYVNHFYKAHFFDVEDVRVIIQKHNFTKQPYIKDLLKEL